MDTFLDLVGKELKKDRKFLPNDINYTLRFKENEKSYASLWFRTRGCWYSRNGGCTMCDYFISEIISEEDIFSCFCQGFNQLEKEPNLMVIMTSGSFFDPGEVPPRVRVQIYEKLAKLQKTIIVFETHANTINEEILDECLRYFPPERINIEIGLESSDEWVRKFCVNKNISNKQLEESFRLMNKKGIQINANIVIGIPFLSVKENIEHATESIKWAFKNGVAQCSLFPVNIKPYTLVQWMYERGLYEQLPLWALIDVLSRVRKPFLPRVNINWYKKSPPLENPLYKKPIIGTDTCDNCYIKVIDLVDTFFLGDVDRKYILDQLNEIHCTCRDKYIQNYNMSATNSLKERVEQYYQTISVELFGKESWREKGSKVTLDLE